MQTAREVVDVLVRQRKSLGIHQSEIAEQLGCGQQLVSYWERGAGDPSVSQLSAYARAVGLELRLELVIS